MPLVGSVTPNACSPEQMNVNLSQRHKQKPRIAVHSNGYSDAMLSDGALSRAELDKAFPTQPVLIENISTLTGMVNSAGLSEARHHEGDEGRLGIHPARPEDRRARPASSIGGPYLDAVARAVGKYSQDLTFETYRKAERIYASNGFTTAQSYAGVPRRHAQHARGVGAGGGLHRPDRLADVRHRGPDAEGRPEGFQFGVYSRGDRGFKVAGMMVPTDGAPQLRLACFTKPYADTTGFGKDWRGFAYNPQGTIDRYAQLAYEKNIPYFGYSNGDAGIDMTLAALDKAIRETGVTEDRRTVISHSMFVRDDQLVQYRDKKVMAIVLSNHVWLYGDVYPRILGEERARNIIPLRSAQAHGVRIGIHNDTPSSGPSAMFSIWSAVNRKTFGGKTLGPGAADRSLRGAPGLHDECRVPVPGGIEQGNDRSGDARRPGGARPQSAQGGSGRHPEHPGRPDREARQADLRAAGVAGERPSHATSRRASRARLVA